MYTPKRINLSRDLPLPESNICLPPLHIAIGVAWISRKYMRPWEVGALSSTVHIILQFIHPFVFFLLATHADRGRMHQMNLHCFAYISTLQFPHEDAWIIQDIWTKIHGNCMIQSYDEWEYTKWSRIHWIFGRNNIILTANHLKSHHRRPCIDCRYSRTDNHI